MTSCHSMKGTKEQLRVSLKPAYHTAYPSFHPLYCYTQANVPTSSPYLAFSPKRAKTSSQRQPTSNDGGNTRTRRYLEKAQIRQLAPPVEGIAALSHPAMVACGAPHDMQRMKHKFWLAGGRRVSVGVDLGTPAICRKNSD